MPAYLDHTNYFPEPELFFEKQNSSNPTCSNTTWRNSTLGLFRFSGNFLLTSACSSCSSHPSDFPRFQARFSYSRILSSNSLSMSLSRPIRLLLLGAPGSGKGTQTSRLLKTFDLFPSLSSGDTLRAEVSQGTALGKEASEHMNNGTLVPDSTMVALIASQLQQKKWLSPSSSWLLDGFPRNHTQAVELDKMLGNYDANLNLVVELDVDQSVILQRIEARWVHLKSGRVYSTDYLPPKVPFMDDITGEPLTKRTDDTAEVFQKRLDDYNREIEPLKDFYDKKGVLHSVSGNTSDEIFPKLKQLVEKMYG